MQFTLATIALAAASLVSAQGAANGLAPSSPPPAGCVTTYPSKFEITVYLAATTKRSLVEREAVTISLTNGVLTDAYGRIGGIVANGQFQFDGPPSQTGTIYNAGWSVCQNGSLALGGSAVFYECGSGSFYNLYDRYLGGQCLPIEIDVVPVAGTTAPVVTQTSDGQIIATSAVSQITDGQIQATSALTRPAVTQITDGQIQATSAKTRPAVTQISDGQIQATRANTKPVVSQYTDGQLQVGTAMPTVTAVKVTQIGDGQIQAPTTLATKPPVVTQIGDGQIQAPNGTATATATRSVVTAGAAHFTMGASFMAAAGAVAGLALL